MQQTDSVSPAPAGEDEWHIAGVIVHVRPEQLAGVRTAIAAMSGAEVHAENEAGKLVVTLEAPSTHAISAQLMFLHQLHGVLSATLVYQHNEEGAAMTEEIRDDRLAPGLY